jgi:hypothetical protein
MYKCPPWTESSDGLATAAPAAASACSGPCAVAARVSESSSRSLPSGSMLAVMAYLLEECPPS